MKKIKFGIFGNGEVIIDDDGFIEIPVIIQESGLFAGTPPAELRIYETGIYGDDEFNKQYVAELNRETDLPFYLTTAKIKVLPGMVEWTDKMLIEHDIKPLDKKEKEKVYTLGDLLRKNIIYTKDGKEYRKIGRDEIIKKGDMQSWCHGELHPIVNSDGKTIGDTPNSFSDEREFYNPL